ncbi:MAG: YggS family pyridoxal phosphate-dependent enzyme [Dehalococcoidia bacterium]
MTAPATSATIAANVAVVRERIAHACERAGRDPSGVTLIAVSKTFGPEAILAALDAGITDFGENRIQEALTKFEAVRSMPQTRDLGLRTHLVGHLQTNKVRAAVGAFDILHAVDSERLLRTIDTAATSPARLMIEVNVSGEATKYGIAPAALPALLRVGEDLPNVRIEGLMTIAPRAADPEDARPVFAQLASLAKEHGLPFLSMGMTEDFEVAISEGATHVRVGRAIFGERV